MKVQWKEMNANWKEMNATWKEMNAKWKEMNAKWKEHERKWMQNERHERTWKQKMTSVDSRPRMLSHPPKAGKNTFLVYRELTTWQNDKSEKNDNVILGHLKRYRVFIQPHLCKVEGQSVPNGKDSQLPYKHLIGQVILDKNKSALWPETCEESTREYFLIFIYIYICYLLYIIIYNII